MTGRKAVPEFLGPDCTPENVSTALSALLTNDADRATQVTAMEETMAALGRGREPPGMRAARSVLEFFG